MTRDSTPEKLAGGRLTIDLTALADNWCKLNAMTPNAECAAVVKANAYGIGIEKAVPALWAAGCRTFFVALPEEGIRVRKAAPEAVIYVLAGYMPDALQTYSRYQLRPVINAEIDEWFAINKRRRNKLPYALQVETGMNRLGLASSDVGPLIAAEIITDEHPPALLMSHLACADDPANPQNAMQLQNFQNPRAELPDVPASFANSAAIFLGEDYHFDLARPGIALYGGAAAKAHVESNPMTPVVTVEARILQLKSAACGAPVGYGGAETLKPSGNKSRLDGRVLVTASVGYSDGYLRASGSSDAKRGASAAWRGHRVPIVGRVSMDLITIDMSDHPELEALLALSFEDIRQEWVELIGHTIPLDEVAGHAGTIGYELLTGLGSRYHRRYIEV